MGQAELIEAVILVGVTLTIEMGPAVKFKAVATVTELKAVPNPVPSSSNVVVDAEIVVAVLTIVGSMPQLGGKEDFKL